MTQLKIDLKNVKPSLIKLVAEALKKGQVVVLPTDTIYGLSCLADDRLAIRRIYKLKGRDEKRPLIILVADLAMLKKYAFVSQSQIADLRRIWRPQARPTTVILRSRDFLPPELNNNIGSLAVRLPKSDFLIKILKVIKKPLVSTSLNLSGETNITDLKFLEHHFPDRQKQPDLVVDSGKCRRRRPSKLIDLSQSGQPVILRKWFKIYENE